MDKEIMIIYTVQQKKIKKQYLHNDIFLGNKQEIITYMCHLYRSLYKHKLNILFRNMLVLQTIMR